jgi:hypothetical protein
LSQSVVYSAAIVFTIPQQPEGSKEVNSEQTVKGTRPSSVSSSSSLPLVPPNAKFKLTIMDYIGINNVDKSRMVLERKEEFPIRTKIKIIELVEAFINKLLGYCKTNGDVDINKALIFYVESIESYYNS